MLMVLETGVGPTASWCYASDKKTSVPSPMFYVSLGRKKDLESPQTYSKSFHCVAESAREF